MTRYVVPLRQGLPGKTGIRVLLPPVILLLVFFVSCSGGDPSAGAGEACVDVVPSPLAVWSEFLTPVEVREQVPRLKRHGLSLYQNIRSREIGDPDVGDLLAEASCQGLEVRAWLTLPEEQGYWPNEKNVDVFAEEALALARWIRGAGWPVDWIVVDMEPDLQMLETLMDMLEEGDLLGAVRLLLENRNPAAFAEATAKYAAMVETLQDMGFRVMIVTFPLVLDGQGDGYSVVEDLMNTPVGGIPWDELSFMAYTSIFSRFLPGEVGPYLVYSYGKDALARYPGRAGLDLGVFGHAGMTGGEGITDIEAFRAQVGAARQAGLERIHAFSLDGIVTDMPDPDRWMEAFQTPAQPELVQVEPLVDIFRALIRFLAAAAAEVRT